MKMVWVETTAQGVPIRIFKSRSRITGHNYVMRWDRATAVQTIRHQLWLRCGGECEWCPNLVTENSGHMHEQKHRGQGGEISLANSVFICPTCHAVAHKNRNPRFTKKRLTSESGSGMLSPDSNTPGHGAAIKT